MLAFAASGAAAQTPASDGIEFDDTLLMKDGSARIDVSRFSHDNPVPPGSYTVDLYLNGDWLGRSGVRFIARDGAASALPCFDRTLVQRLGLKYEALTELDREELARTEAGDCADIARVVDGATWRFDLSDLRLEISVPQVALTRNPRGYVGPEMWAEGVPSATLSYNTNVFHSTAAGLSSTQAYASLSGSLNIGNWHLRNDSTLNWDNRGGLQYQNIQTYLQRDLPALRAQLTIGESFTDGALFDSIGMRGVQLATDDRMLPDSQRGYAPVIHGIAMTNALVTVSQQGNILYETTVPPGQFRIDDLYATGYGGDLLVTVTEADGSRHSFTVPYASVVQLLRPGVSRFSVAAGQLRDAQADAHPNFVQGTYQYGFNNLLTGYAGAILAEGYMSGLAGAAINTPVGAFAADVTVARANIPGVSADTTGHSLRLAYSKILPQTGTNVTVAAYRYSSSGFWTMREALLARSGDSTGIAAFAAQRQRNQFQLTLNQALGNGWGSVYAVGSLRNYWNGAGSDTQFQVGYSNVVRVAGYDIGYNIALSRERSASSGQLTNQVFANVTLPLGRSTHAPTLSTNVTHSNRSGTSELATLSGTAGEFNEFTYGVNAGHQPGITTGGANVQYRAQGATLTASTSAGTGYSQVAAGASGGVVVHPGGVSFANSLSDTVGIVEAKDAAGARIENWPGVSVDSRGYAVLPYLNPYHLNTIQLDPRGLPLDVELETTSQQVAPRANGVTMVRFATRTGRAALLNVRLADGSAPPFGAEVLDRDDNVAGVLGQGGHVWLRGLSDEGSYEVRWSAGAAPQVCRFDYRLPARGTADANRLSAVDVSCAAEAPAPTPSGGGEP